MIESGRRVQAGPDLVASLHIRGDRTQRQIQHRRAHDRHRPVADDRLEAHQIVIARVLRVGAPHGLREAAVVAVADGSARRRAADERPARRRCADQQAGDRVQRDPPGDLLAAVVVGEQRVGGRARGHRPGGVDERRGRVHLHARVPPEGADERHAVVRGLIADGEAREPPAAAHPQQVVGAGGHGVGAKRRQVLVADGIADQKIVGGVGAARKRAEGRRHASHLDVERAIGPRSDPRVQRVRARRGRVLAAHVAENRQVVAGFERRGQVDAQHPQRRVLVIGVVEKAGVLRGE